VPEFASQSTPPGVWVSQSIGHEQLRLQFPQADYDQHWDELLLEQRDAVIVNGVSDEILTAAREFARHGAKIFVVTLTNAGPAQLFRFTSLWQEFPRQVIPLFCSGARTAGTIALQCFRKLQHGQLWKIEFTRTLSVRSLPGTALTPELIDQFLLEDLQWLCELAGAPQHVTMQLSGPPEHPAEAIVRLEGEGIPEVKWTLQTHLDPDCWNIKLTGVQNEVQVRYRAGHALSFIENNSESPLVCESPSICLTASKLLSESPLAADMVRQLEGHAPGTETASQPGWAQLIQLAEIGAAARRSFLRRRTVDVHFAEGSERSHFKSQMTAVGCGVLLWTMFSMIAMLLVAGLLDPRDREFRHSTAAGFVLRDPDFIAESEKLTSTGQRTAEQIAAKWSAASPVLIIEEATVNQADLNRKREQTVIDLLLKQGIRSPQERVSLRPLPGAWFETFMRLSWIAVFGPLVIVLILQLLIFAARKPALLD